MAEYRNTYGYPKWLDISNEWLSIGIKRLLFFNVGILSNAYRVTAQTRFFSRVVP